MKQLIEPNLNIPYVGGLCEGYVEGMWGQATLPTRKNQMTYGVYGNAVSPVNAGETAKWDSNPGNGNHPNDIPPMGVKIPVYFWLGSTPAGHTATSLGDGTYLSSSLPGFQDRGYHHPSLQHLIDFYAPANNGCKYLGWSEYVGNIKVVEEDEMVKKDQVRALFRAFRGREPYQQELDQFVDKIGYDALIVMLDSGEERSKAAKAQLIGFTAVKDDWHFQIEDLQKKLAEAQNGESVKKLEQIKAIVNG